MIQIFNTLSREKEKFKPLKQEVVKIYCCGITPYNFAHIGNLRAYLFEDLVIRTLEFSGYKLDVLMNVTDIDDKTIKNSQKLGQTRDELTQFYTQAFLSDLEALSIQKADKIVPISTLIAEMVMMIQGLLDKGFAYLGEDQSIYFRVAQFQSYGELAHLDMSQLLESVRIKNDEYSKDQVADFALWKGYDESDGPNFWEESFAINGLEMKLKGRPGWHIECSACNLRYHGEQIDIHMGGVDNIFPHHQNEIAQTEAYTGKIFSKYWIHSGHLLVDNKKMAKSAGNFYTLRDIIDIGAKKGYSAQEVCRGFRLMSLSSLYRDNFNFSFEKLDQSVATLKRIDEFFARIKRSRGVDGKIRRVFSQNLQAIIQDYSACLFDDFRSHDALVIVYDAISYFQREIDTGLMTDPERDALRQFFETLQYVLQIFDLSIFSTVEIPREIIELAEARLQAKNEKRYTDADALRLTIADRGYRLIDTPQGFNIELL